MVLFTVLFMVRFMVLFMVLFMVQFKVWFMVHGSWFIVSFIMFFLNMVDYSVYILPVLSTLTWDIHTLFHSGVLGAS